MIITTSLRENEALIARAQELAYELGADYQPRRKLSLAKCLERFGAFYLLYKDRLSFVNANGSEGLMVQGNRVLLESRYECQFQKQVK